MVRRKFDCTKNAQKMAFFLENSLSTPYFSQKPGFFTEKIALIPIPEVRRSNLYTA